MSTKTEHLIPDLIAAAGVVSTAVNVWNEHWGMAILTGGFGLMLVIETAATRVIRAIEKASAPAEVRNIYTYREGR